ncbi:MAG: PQQ-binding-like beta-propeller repeat protein, partial [Polyangiaceae bacterium]
MIRPRAKKIALRITCGAALPVAFSALSACATGDTANDRVNPETPLWYHRPSGAMQLVVHRKLTAEPRKVGEDYERGRAEIDPAHDRVFIGSADHGLYALRSGDGSTIWRFETLSYVQCEPYYDAELDMLYFGSHDGAIYAVHAFDGSLAWRFFTGA